MPGLRFLAIVIFGWAGVVHATPDTVPFVDIDRYEGKWFELFRVPNTFQDFNQKKYLSPCFNTTAQYSLLPNGKIGVLNTCFRKNSKTNEIETESAKAIGRVKKDTNNSKLKVNFTGIALLRFLGIGDGDYWIYGLGEINENGDYAWALVGSPKLDYGWILSRTEELNEHELERIFSLIDQLGYKPNQFIKTRR